LERLRVVWRLPLLRSFTGKDRVRGFRLLGCFLYLVGAILVTIACNVPLNDALAAVDPSKADAVPIWTNYLKIWTAWNHVRTVASLAAAALFTVAFCRASS